MIIALDESGINDGHDDLLDDIIADVVFHENDGINNNQQQQEALEISNLHPPQYINYQEQELQTIENDEDEGDKDES